LGRLSRLDDGRTALVVDPPEAWLESRSRVAWRSRSLLWPQWAARAPRRFAVLFAGVDLGEGTVTSYGREDWRTARADLGLLTPVDDARWEAAGGWHSFALRVGAPTHRGVAAAEVRAAVEAALASGTADLEVATSHDEALSMLVAGDRVFVMHQTRGDTWAVASDPARPEGSVAFTLDNGQVDELDRRSTVPPATALQALDAFLAGRGRSPDVVWSDDV
jgi:hypothetical protein